MTLYQCIANPGKIVSFGVVSPSVVILESSLIPEAGLEDDGPGQFPHILCFATDPCDPDRDVSIRCAPPLQAASGSRKPSHGAGNRLEPCAVKQMIVSGPDDPKFFIVLCPNTAGKTR